MDNSIYSLKPQFFSEHGRYVIYLDVKGRINDGIIAIIDAIPGVELITIRSKYSADVIIGKMFSPDIHNIMQQIADKVIDFYTPETIM